MVGIYDLASRGKDSFPGTLLTDTEVEDRLNNIAFGSLERYLEKLQRLGFPEPVAETGERWDAGAVWQWMRAMAQMNRQTSPETAPALAAMEAAIARARRARGEGS
jgi:hypothetical protein